jgi:hypothetical protein
MSDIFWSARTVVVWLGLGTADSNYAINTLRLRLESELCFARTVERTVGGKLTDMHGSSSISALFDRPYWCRMWVVQELFLARSVLLCAGRKGLWFERKEATADDGQFHLTAWLADLVQEYENKSLPKGFEFFRIVDSDRRRDIPLSKMVDLLEQWNDQGCRDPRDKVYSLPGLLRRIDSLPTVDYSMSIEQLHAQVLCSHAAVMKGSGVECECTFGCDWKPTCRHNGCLIHPRQRRTPRSQAKPG